MGLLMLREMRSISVLITLKDTNHVSAQRRTFVSSKLSCSTEVTGLSTVIKRLVSSENRRMLELVSLTMSLCKEGKGKDLNRALRYACFYISPIRSNTRKYNTLFPVCEMFWNKRSIFPDTPAA